MTFSFVKLCLDVGDEFVVSVHAARNTHRTLLLVRVHYAHLDDVALILQIYVTCDLMLAARYLEQQAPFL